MDGFNLHDELSAEVWRATTSKEGEEEEGEGEEGGTRRVLLKFPEDCTSLSAFSACRREYEMGARLRDIEGVLAPKQILEGDGMVGLLFDEPAGGDLLANYIPTFHATYSPCASDGLCEFLRLSINLAKLVAEIHDKGIVLCYIRPENILVTPQEVLLFDFSHATNFPANPSVLGLADCDLRYMSPEATGRTQHNVDVRSDLYSLGATLFHLITGRVPFQFDTAAALVYAHIAKKPPQVSDLVPTIPTVISQIIARLLNKSPLERYQTAYGLKWDLEQCRALLRDNHISSFPLGTHDQIHKFSLPSTIFGREHELAVLNTTFEKVASGSSELIFVSGVSGIGKTSLIQTAQQQLDQPTAFFISGKFDQINQFSPYSAFLQAAADLMKQVLALDKRVIEMYKQKLKDVLGSSAQVLIEVIPLLELIIGHHDPAPDLPPIESRNRFNNMFQDFFQVFAGEGSPLFLFVDDLQWADSSTLQMVKLLSSRALPYTALICAYRSNEVSPTSGAGKMVEECRTEFPLSPHIELGPLNIQSLDCLVRYAFPGTNTMPLSQLVLKKTEGNPFFVLQFLRTIHNEGMMHFDPTAESWYWDEQEIHTMCSTNNVVEFMVQTLSKFDQTTQNILSFAGCLGNCFNLEMLAIAADQMAQKTLSSLDKALHEEYVIKLNDNYFKFVHDRVQQAAFFLIPEKRRPEKQLLIAKRLLNGLSKSSIDQHLFNIVSLLNLGSSLVSNDKDKEQICQLNYSAGIKAKNSTAYGPALIYLRTAASFLDNDPWTDKYAFTFSLNEALCECEFLSGSLQTAEEIAQQAILHATSRKDKCAIYRILVQQLVIAGQSEKAIEAGFTCFELYSIHNSKNPTDAEIMEVYTEAKKKLLALPSVNYLVEAPAATGTVQECFKIVAAMIPAAFFFNLKLLMYMLSRFLICMIQEGKTPHNAIVIVWFASVVAGTRYHDFQLGFELGQVALKLNEQYNEPSSTMIGNFVFGAFISYWKLPFSATIPYLLKSYKGAIECGDLGYACYTVCHLFIIHLMIGTPLKEYFSFLEPYAAFVHSSKFGEMRDMISVITIAISSLRLGGGLKVLVDPDYLMLEDRILNTRSLIAQSYHFIFKMMVQCYLGDFKGVLISAKHSENALAGTYGQDINIYHYFFYNVALAAAHTHKGEGSEEALKQIELNHIEIELYANVSPENFQVLYQISQACIKKLQGDIYSVFELLESSIETASTQGLIPIKALANERLANALTIRGKTKAAELYIIESLSAWEQYGAFVKIDEIQQKYPAIRWKKVKYKPPQQNSLGTIDLHSILAASHSLSEQIMLPQLLTQLMTITMETAGAERGYLLLPKEDDPDVFWTAAESIGEQNIHVHVYISNSDGRESLAQVSEAILNYVKRTRTVVVLADASTDKQWKSDPYISSRQTKSVLCIPFARQGNLEAILYLENNLVAGAFSSEFLNVLNMLAAQAAISIQNSRMYMHLLRAKEQVQRAIEAQRHLSESLPLIVYSLRADGEIEYINQRWCTYTGLSLDESLGHHLYSCNLHPEDAVRVAEAVVAGAHEGKDLDIECRIQRADGVYLWHLLRAEAKRDMNGGGVFMGWNGTFMDIDDRKKIEEINKADKAKSRFLASMSHEMRTPLSGVIGMASLLCTTSLSSEQTDMVHTISMCSELLLVLINNILDIFKLEENKVVLEKLEISPLECAEKSMDIITVGANDKKIDVILDFDDDVPPFVIGDSHRLEQIFINLLGNAVKFTPEGGEIIVQGARDPTFPDDGDDKSMQHLQFTVQDTGVGVPPEGEAKLFQLFSQCDTSTTRVFGGTGLGLAISKRLVEMMGGQIWYENRGKGATFVFTIVVPRANTTAINGLSPPKVESVYLAGRPSTLHNVIARKLKRTGASITTTTEFDTSLVKSSFCTIVVDGEEVDWSAQSLPPGAHVLALSRNIQIYDKLPKGLTFLRKPVKFRRLMQYLSKIRIPEKELVSTLKQKNHLEYSLRILLADDNEMNLKVALKLLASIGYSNVKVARNGIEVLQELERGDFDIILMDMEMPLMDGCQATAIIRSKMRDTPIHIISMTANAFPEDWARCANAGMCSYLPKPFKRETLQAELNKAILVQMGKHYCNQCSPKTFSPSSPLSPSPPPTLSLLPSSPAPNYHPNLTSSTKTLSNILV